MEVPQRSAREDWLLCPRSFSPRFFYYKSRVVPAAVKNGLKFTTNRELCIGANEQFYFIRETRSPKSIRGLFDLHSNTRKWIQKSKMLSASRLKFGLHSRNSETQYLPSYSLLEICYKILGPLTINVKCMRAHNYIFQSAFPLAIKSTLHWHSSKWANLDTSGLLPRQ